MSRPIDAELEQLKKDALHMGEIAKNSVEEAVQAIINRDEKLASEVIKGGSVVDKYEFDIENMCMRLMALRQPLAKDLRMVATVMKIITDLDRINDLAKDIAVICLNMGKEPFAKPLIDIPRMSQIAQEMIADCLGALSIEDTQALKGFTERDNMVDALMEQVRRELITIMLEKPHLIPNSNRLLFVALHLERIADHACNIASRLYYMFTGERVKFE